MGKQTKSLAANAGLTGLLMDRLVRAAAARYPAAYGELGLGKPGLVVLAALHAAGPLRQARLAERTGIDKATLVALLNELEGEGYATRAPDPDDRRAHVVSITPTGQRLVVRAERLAAEDDFFAALTPAEHATLEALLTKLLAAHVG